MKIWFGPQKGKAVKELTDADLTSLSGWITGLLESPTAPSGSKRREFTRLLLQIGRELGTREGDEAPALDPEGPVTLLQSLTPAQAKVAFTVAILAAQADGQPFQATYDRLMAEGALGSRHAVSDTRRLLLSLGLIKETSRGEVVLAGVDSADTAQCLRVFLLSFLSGKDSKTGTDNGSTVQYQHSIVDQAVSALHIEMDEFTRRMARDKLTALLRTGTYTGDDAVKVAKWARGAYNSGENRWILLLDLVYLWTLPRFAAFLGAAKSPDNPKTFESIIDPDDREMMRKEIDEKIKKRGLR